MIKKTIIENEQLKLVTLLRQVRLESHLRQIDLAKRLDLPQSFISKYESGERRLNILELRKVCNAIGISFVDFTRRLDDILK